MLGVALLIALGALISEDASTLSAAYLAAGGNLNLPLAFASAFLGIWIGDLGLYALARLGRESLGRSRFARWLDHAAIQRSMHALRTASTPALLLCRFVPGTRLPTYLASGFVRLPATRFAVVTGLCAAVWIAIVFAVANGTLRTPVLLGIGHSYASVGIAVASGLALVYLGKKMLARQGTRISAALTRWSRWEFWPAWLFYAPVFLICVWLGIRYRGFALPTVANPGQHNGGVVGESKVEILRQLRAIAPEFTAEAHLIVPGDLAARMRALEWAVSQERWQFPIILKPDIAQRGAGFRRVYSLFQAREYLAALAAPVIAQRYVPGPFEAGIFYYRFPHEKQGRIFAITEKHFPELVGNGTSTLRELVCADGRARLIAKTYLNRFEQLADRVVPSGERVRLVEAGNHCQGCIFKDGWHLYTPELEVAVDAICRELPGFFIGRLDVRFGDVAAFRAGHDFTILELNGATSEATNIYDERNSLWSAYRTLYQQWDLVYAIGDANRARGHRPVTPWRVLRDWIEHRKLAKLYPAAD
jgi:membrane protein DedA with SNARE-associated domain